MQMKFDVVNKMKILVFLKICFYLLHIIGRRKQSIYVSVGVILIGVGNNHVLRPQVDRRCW